MKLVSAGLQREDARNGEAQEEEQKVPLGSQSFAEQEPHIDVQSRRASASPWGKL